MKVKECSKCHLFKSLSNFTSNKEGKCGRYSVCKSCVNKNQKKQRQTPEGKLARAKDLAKQRGFGSNTPLGEEIIFNEPYCWHHPNNNDI